MSITRNDLMKLATALAKGQTECEWRSGASRAYYSVFHKALEAADNCLPPNPYRGGEHERLTERFSLHSNAGKSLAYRLIDLKKVRTLADYKLNHSFGQQDAADLIANCPSVERQIDAFEAHVLAMASKPKKP